MGGWDPSDSKKHTYPELRVLMPSRKCERHVCEAWGGGVGRKAVMQRLKKSVSRVVWRRVNFAGEGRSLRN